MHLTAKGRVEKMGLAFEQRWLFVANMSMAIGGGVMVVMRVSDSKGNIEYIEACEVFSGRGAWFL
jgi:hypothetical protein